jgi:hypothetical protein
MDKKEEEEEEKTNLGGLTERTILVEDGYHTDKRREASGIEFPIQKFESSEMRRNGSNGNCVTEEGRS